VGDYLHVRTANSITGPPRAEVDAVVDTAGVEIGDGQPTGTVAQHVEAVDVGDMDPVALGEPVNESLEVLVATAVAPAEHE
jgi:hypothetical protein